MKDSRVILNFRMIVPTARNNYQSSYRDPVINFGIFGLAEMQLGYVRFINGQTGRGWKNFDLPSRAKAVIICGGLRRHIALRDGTHMENAQAPFELLVRRQMIRNSWLLFVRGITTFEDVARMYLVTKVHVTCLGCGLWINACLPRDFLSCWHLRLFRGVPS